MEPHTGATPVSSAWQADILVDIRMRHMVSVVGFQPTTFPAQTGRAKQTALHGDKWCAERDSNSSLFWA